MELARLLAERFLDLALVRIAGDAEHLVGIAWHVLF
jgi:hypothetical protein